MSLQSVPRIEKLWEVAELNYSNKRHPDDFPALPEIPAGRYTRDDFFRLEKERMWRRTWLLAGISDELPSPGSYRTLTINDVPVLLVRGNDGAIRAFYNTCQHRGSMLVSKAQGAEQQFACPYHCWTYDLEGKLKFVADERQFPGLDKSTKSLRPIRCEFFGSLIFVNFDSKASPLTEFLGDILGLLADVPMDGLQLYKRIHLEAPYNWKIVQENFSESLHTKFIHPTTLEPMINTKALALQLLANGHAASAVKTRIPDDGGREVVNLWESSASDNIETRAKKGMLGDLTRISQRNYNIFPNITLPPGENTFPIIVVWPISLTRSRLEIYILKIAGRDERINETNDEAMANGLEAVIMEDFHALDGIQAAMSGGGIDAVRLSWEEQIIYNHNNQLDHVIGRDNIPAELAVKDIELPLSARE